MQRDRLVSIWSAQTKPNDAKGSSYAGELAALCKALIELRTQLHGRGIPMDLRHMGTTQDTTSILIETCYETSLVGTVLIPLQTRFRATVRRLLEDLIGLFAGVHRADDTCFEKVYRHIAMRRNKGRQALDGTVAAEILTRYPVLVTMLLSLRTGGKFVVVGERCIFGVVVRSSLIRTAMQSKVPTAQNRS
eukprot:GHVO01012671.1.p1 GENE.GHVO01012671.1~~GHVO01012671.1.p1  ORF type:complete len:191 (+),score=4.93 GHVO01012671.1:68-640(+)